MKPLHASKANYNPEMMGRCPFGGQNMAYLNWLRGVSPSGARGLVRGG